MPHLILAVPPAGLFVVFAFCVVMHDRAPHQPGERCTGRRERPQTRLNVNRRELKRVNDRKGIIEL